MAASSSTGGCVSYEIFLNHRGPDVKKTFVSHLYLRLVSQGLKVFLDQEELQVGEYLTSQIESAIRTASVHVAVFSPGYADSNWCLNELLQTLESRKTIIPVFYGVKPSELRWTQGNLGKYAEALQSLANKTTCDDQPLQKKLRYDSNTIESWRNALATVSQISGLELESCNGDEGKLLDLVVEDLVTRNGTMSPVFGRNLREKPDHTRNAVCNDRFRFHWQETVSRETKQFLLAVSG